ncbi:unnamed protein product [Candidula unifasciata]|uniref:TLDc domain-containing protein n=1 Tax=Candidula unifasciata TaxID=100452 RepID=A0A8S3Z6X4_9EUPU|nr:unnamed protein product [Candidula unifasciata]
MGNTGSQTDTEKHSNDRKDEAANLSRKGGVVIIKDQTGSLVKLFEKFKLTEDRGSDVSCELWRTTFESAFEGAFHLFGKLLYRCMVDFGGAEGERITQEQFIKAGNEIFNFDERRLVNHYFHFFAEGRDVLKKDDARTMFEVSFLLTLSVSRILYQEDKQDAAMFDAMVTGLFGSKTEVSVSDLSRWLKKSCPHLFDSVHSWVMQVLAGSTMPQEMDMAQVALLEEVVSGSGCMTTPILWALSMALPPVYITLTVNTGPASALPSSSAAEKATLGTSSGLKRMEPLPHLHRWKLLYSSSEHGMSINRFKHHVSAYNAPSVTVISFEGGNIYCLAVDRSWLEGLNKFGGANCMLIQLLPTFQVVQAGEKMVRWNEAIRGIPKGISIGCDGKPEVLRISPDFDSVLHYTVPHAIHRIEVWGCGTDSTLQAQKNLKDWESKAVERERERKLRPAALGEDLQNNPDRQILQWGGVNVGGQSYR